ncbi:MAG TPA: glycoside hydrolase family 11 protein [Polyangiaceae bacterium]
MSGAGAAGTGTGTTSGAAGASGAAGTSSGPDCSATLPTAGTTHTGTSINGAADGLNYGIWTNGAGGSITVFNNARAFSASWDNSADFLAHVGLDFNAAKSYTAYGAIVAQFVESKMGTSGVYSSIGMYGWMHSPCVEWYINEDSFTTLYPRGTVTATIDGATYYLYTTTTTGTGGANACEAGHTGSWTQMISTRKTARQCGTVTVSDHFAAWAEQGWNLGTLASVHINVEVGGGTGSIQFPVANVTTTSN